MICAREFQCGDARRVDCDCGFFFGHREKLPGDHKKCTYLPT